MIEPSEDQMKAFLNTRKFREWLIMYDSTPYLWWMGWTSHEKVQKWVGGYIARKVRKKLARLKEHYRRKKIVLEYEQRKSQRTGNIAQGSLPRTDEKTMKTMKTKFDKDLIELAAIRVADLWAEQVQKPMNKDNGDDNPLLFMLATIHTQTAQESISAEKIETFKQSVIREVRNKLLLRGQCWLDCDYGPDDELGVACACAAIPTGALPWKSSTRIDLKTNRIDYRFGYPSTTKSESII